MMMLAKYRLIHNHLTLGIMSTDKRINEPIISNIVPRWKRKEQEKARQGFILHISFLWQKLYNFDSRITTTFELCFSFNQDILTAVFYPLFQYI